MVIILAGAGLRILKIVPEQARAAQTMTMTAAIPALSILTLFEYITPDFKGDGAVVLIRRHPDTFGNGFGLLLVKLFESTGKNRGLFNVMSPGRCRILYI